ncbi:MAG: N-acetylmuramoyl-L-alanine amidase [Oscillospiraceae bacterium]
MSDVLKELLANPGGYGGSRDGQSDQIPGVSRHRQRRGPAVNNAAYFQNNVVEASAHYFVDDTAVWRSVPDLQVAWAVGGKKYANAGKTGGGTMHGIITNTNSISIEMCDTIRNGICQASEDTLANAAALGRELMAGCGIQTCGISM